MTITANDRRKTYQGNGVATDFTGPRAFTASHVLVFVGTAPNYALIPGSQYTVSGAGMASPQTVVKFNTAPALNADILILRLVPYDQPTDITNQGRFLPELHEGAFDYRVMQIQQLADGSLSLVLDPDSGEFVWDAKGMRIVRVGNAVADTDAVNLGTLYTYVEQIQNGGGAVGVAPKSWGWVGDGVTTAFAIPGADVSDPLFYDGAMEATAGAGDYQVMRPTEDFSVSIAIDTDDSMIRFPTAPAAGQRAFAILRGYARPYTGANPIYTTAPRIVHLTDTALTVDGTYQNTLILAESAGATTITIRKNTGAANDWTDGEYFSVCQIGIGKVTLAIQSGGALVAPESFTLQSRGLNSIVSASCTIAASDTWRAAGDLLRQALTPELQHIAIDDRSVLIGTNIAAGTGKASFFMPYGFVLNSVATSGCYATLAVAQTAGAVVTVDVNRNGTSILATKLTFDNAERTTLTAATPPVYAAGGDVLYAGDEITIDVDQVGTALAKGLTVYLVGQRAS